MDFTVVHPHWIILSLCLVFLPRLTLLFMLLLIGLCTPDGGYFFLFWFGWLVFPRLTVAILALPYFAANPVLVVLAWIVAFSGETAEKRSVSRTRDRS